MKKLILLLMLISGVMFGQWDAKVIMDSTNATTDTIYFSNKVDDFQDGTIFISVDDSTTVKLWIAVESDVLDSLTEGGAFSSFSTQNDFAQDTTILGASSVSNVKKNYFFSDIVAQYFLFEVEITGSGTNNQKIAVKKGK